MTLKEKLNEVEATLIGNRVTVLGTTLITSGLASLCIKAPSHPSFINIIPEFIIGSVGASFVGYTQFGGKMISIYKRTTKHLKRFNKFDERFFTTIVGNDSSCKFTGYCQLQAMYLAARDSGNPENVREFAQLKKQYTRNIVPNF